MATEAVRREAVADLIGGLCYSLLRVFEIAAGATSAAPTAALAERQASFAVEEFERYRILRERLGTLVQDTERAMQALRSTVDAFYDAARAPGWLEAQVFHFVGSTLTTDFAEMLASRVDEETAFAVRRALTGRTEQEAFALEQITAALVADGTEARERAGHYTGEMVGLGLGRLREALLASDALAVVLGGEEAVKDVVLDLLGRHRERLEHLGLDTIDD